jgi:methionyl-tRNA synthetase
MKGEISFDNFEKLDIRIGEILSAEKVPSADKLLKLTVDVGEEKPRTIISGIAESFPDPSVLIGKKYPFLLNIEPRTIKGYESQGMILAVDAGRIISLFSPENDVPNGSIIR